MNKLVAICVSVITAAMFSCAEETVTWNTAANTVTYSYSVASLSGVNNAFSVAYFDTAQAAAQEGLSGGTYSLAKVVLSIDGSIQGYFQFANLSGTESRNVDSATLMNSPGFSFTAKGKTVTETFSADASPVSLAPNQVDTQNFTATGNGPKTLDITTSLSDFLGSGYFNATVGSKFGIYASADSQVASSINTPVTGTVSLQYFYNYTEVPEPSTATMLALGCVAFLARRRRQAVL